MQLAGMDSPKHDQPQHLPWQSSAYVAAPRPFYDTSHRTLGRFVYREGPAPQHRNFFSETLPHVVIQITDDFSKAPNLLLIVGGACNEPRLVRAVERLAEAGEEAGQHRQNCLHTRPPDFVFCKSDGSPLQPDLLRREVLYPTLDRRHIPRSLRSAGLHTFWHSAGSFVNAETGNLKLAQKLLGHSNLSTTADIYKHTSAEAERDAAVAVERAIYGDLFPIVPKTGNRNNQTATL